MALKNAFENISTENGLRRIANLLTFARTSSDQIRVVVDSGTIGSASVNNLNTTTALTQNVSPSWYSASSWSGVDAREPLKTSINAASADARRNRWTVS